MKERKKPTPPRLLFCYAVAAATKALSSGPAISTTLRTQWNKKGVDSSEQIFLNISERVFLFSTLTYNFTKDMADELLQPHSQRKKAL